jgi:hypothetical protein
MKIRSAVKTKREPSVQPSNRKASFLEPFKYQIMGRPNTSDPVTAAERTSRESITIGTSNSFDALEPNKFSAPEKNNDIAVI